MLPPNRAAMGQAGRARWSAIWDRAGHAVAISKRSSATVNEMRRASSPHPFVVRELTFSS